ncbi:YfiT family bacillithiol transferase [Arsenicibacter rosenii]|uniref:Metal-dependent hydrolase n=1 Tax=Arsenicibacter rosenii TaxID=1750698 RepID=A0A1S2VIZ3_9BACT|nr:putative metal-dependent hydrolase [Arsenicibacter rosenii]OIN58737.1 metal-dependent hydrolase [Arsenicibacter rosenii]
MDLRYPIGDFEYGKSYSFEDIKAAIAAIAVLPFNLTELVGKWGDDRLDTPYRPEGWTVRQLVHHIADSHLNAYVRTKLALTEENPTIKGYEEAEWAKLPDSALSVAPSLVIISNLHLRWVTVLESLTEADFDRTYYHPGYQRSFRLGEVMALYAWHSEHHYQHIYQLAKREQWI